MVITWSFWLAVSTLISTMLRGVPLWDDPRFASFWQRYGNNYSALKWRHWLCKTTSWPLHIIDLPLTCPQYDGTSIWNQYTARPALWQVSICLDIAKLTSDVLLWPGVSSELMEVMVWCCWMLHRFLCLDPGEVPSCSSCWKLQARSSLLWLY